MTEKNDLRGGAFAQRFATDEESRATERPFPRAAVSGEPLCLFCQGLVKTVAHPMIMLRSKVYPVQKGSVN
ncbi:hypothetical protein [Hydrogenophaga sp. T2]|uniref:hypothetical protein n=1 Tax=Hydrogenophaga sp. T2 TaxID=3132823 RepID=UPI003CEFBBB9